MAKRKTPTRRKVSTKKRTKKKSSFLFIFIIVLIALIPACVSIYLLSQNYFYKEQITEVKKQNIQSNELIKKMRKMLETEQKRIQENSIKEIKEENTKEKNKFDEKNTEISAFEPMSTEAIDYEESLKETSLQYEDKNESKYEKKAFKGKPKLVIIIDDVAFLSQAKAIKQIDLKITPSIFPPSSIHPDTIRISKLFSFFMIHFPLQAISHDSPESQTLKITDSYETIENRVKSIKKSFPKAVYYNNHTGSKFTSDYEAMKKLYKIFKKEGLVFVDSKTTPISKAEKLAKEYKMPYFARDIFLDNSLNKFYIKNQLQKAVHIAQKRGYAIAIGHPHKNTLSVIKESKSMLKSVKVVYLKDLK